MKDIKDFEQSREFYLSHSWPRLSKIKKVCVIGSGVMGSKIAALIANASIEVILLDVLSVDHSNPNKIALAALEQLLAQNPSGFTSEGRRSFIRIGNLTDDLQLINECDLVIEAIVEKFEIKIDLYAKIIPYLKNEAIIASNTSTIPLNQLKQHIPASKKSKFIITHFFNPPRLVELVELVLDQDMSNFDIETISKFITDDLGKTMVKCSDTPGFVANRIGCFLLELVVRKAIAQNLNPIIIDNIFIKLFGLPKTGIFGLYDLIGHDVLKLISDSLIKNLSSEDKYNDIYVTTPLIDNMLRAGIIGRKSGSGFYRYKPGKIKEVIDFQVYSKDTWHPTYSEQKEKFAYQDLENETEFDNIDQLLTGDSRYSIFFQEIITKFYAYILTLVPSVASTDDIDLVMKLGYNWKYGPFEILNSSPKITRLITANQNLDKKIVNAYTNTDSLQTIDDQHEIIIYNSSCHLESREGNLVFAINTKMNCLNSEVFELLLQSIDYAESINQNIYIYSSTSPNFSAGADLKFFYELITTCATSEIDKFLQLGQKAMMRLKYSTINIISCARGFALGGGCELLLHSDWVIAHSELKAGLVEVGVGLIAGWGGIKEIFIRSQGKTDLLVKNIDKVINYNKSSSADNFTVDFALVNYKVVMNSTQLLKKAFTLKIPNKTISNQNNIILPNIELINYFRVESLTELQQEIIKYFQKLINLKNVDEQQLLNFEREVFISLCKRPEVVMELKKILT